jgi:lysine 6-dehydrogenase
MSYVYAILGSGRQGTAAAYDLALRGEAEEIRLIDSDRASAERAVERLKKLVHGGPAPSGAPELRALHCDVRDGKALAGALAGSDAVLSAIPYRFNTVAARAAIAARCHFNDLGGNTAVVQEELAMGGEAKAAGVSIVPDCGLAPGMSQTLAVYAMSKIETPKHVRIRCGGLPQNPRPPLGYRLVFNVAGLTNEYTGSAVCLRNGRITELPAFTEPEDIDFPQPVGRCEAFLTSGGTSTAPWSFQGKLETYDYKTVRYKGHFERMRCLIDLGFLDTAPVEVQGSPIVPREMTHALFESHLNFPDDPDLVVLRVECSGENFTGPGGAKGPANYRIDILDFQDAQTGFTAMERTTAYPAAIVTYLQASGAVAPGAAPLELAVPADRFLSLLDRRGFKIVHARL